MAILAMQICLAIGANVYVTSGNPDKIRRATSLGVKGGANYNDSRFHHDHVLTLNLITILFCKESWPVQVSALLAKEKKGTMLDAIIDSGGGDIMGQAGKILKQGGRVVCYGM